MPAEPGPAPKSVSVQQYYFQYYPDYNLNFGKGEPTNVQLASPAGVDYYMNRGVNGKQRTAQAEGYNFKLTIEDGSTATIGKLVDQIERFPKPYLRALQEVSDARGEDPSRLEDGIATYKDLGGAAGHGGKFYLNVHQGVIDKGDAMVIAHEMGHVLEQTFSKTDNMILDRWAAAARTADGRSVSPYDDGATLEDLAEFSMFYAVALDYDLKTPGGTMLTELRELSPQRFAIWESILKL